MGRGGYGAIQLSLFQYLSVQIFSVAVSDFHHFVINPDRASFLVSFCFSQYLIFLSWK